MEFTPDQIQKLQSLGVNVKQKKRQSNFFPLLSISGLTILSFGGLILLKSKVTNPIPNTQYQIPNTDLKPTQVPKSIQHYLLTSQQFFSQALQLQNESRPVKGGVPQQRDGGFQSQTVDLLNQSILAATEAIKEFPQDYRGYQQRGRIYQALIDSKPELIDQSISDLTTAQKLNSNSAEITHTLASLYAKKGDAQNTIVYLNQTVALEPTKAQNFYDLAKIQQQVGLLPQALETYNRLITLVTDSDQKTQIESEKSALEKLISQNPNSASQNSTPSPTIYDLSPTISVDSPTIQALTDNGLIIAAPDENKNIEVKNLADSNSLSGNSTLVAGQKEITISNTNLISTSQVYVTATKGGKNQNLQVLSKSEKSFTVGLSSPPPAGGSEDIEFKWWIIN